MVKTRTCCMLFCMIAAGFILTESAFAAEALRVVPTSLECGTVDEGVPATMTATVENIGSQDVHIRNVRTN